MGLLDNVMTQTPTLPSYEELSSLLLKFLPNSHAAQLHGLITGNICVTSDNVDEIQKIFPEVKKNAKLLTILQEVYEKTYHLLSEFSFEFTLILPNDGIDINVRAESLGLWCQGFVTQLQENEALIRERVSDEAQEAINDFIEIAQVNFGDIATNEEDETAYFELVEYVRLSVLMIFQELKGSAIAPAEIATNNKLIH